MNWIKLLPLMLYPELEQNPSYLNSKMWKMYLLLKCLCEYFLSPRKSDYQIDVQTKIVNDYLKIRLSLIDEIDAPAISPKHIFVQYYAEIERQVGCVANLQTNIGESKVATICENLMLLSFELHD